jgi:cytochrome c oxidase subunit IV
MSHVNRILQVSLVAIVCFALAPSRATAVAYALVVGSLLIIVLVVLGVARVVYNWMEKVFR